MNILLVFLGIVVVICLNSIAVATFREKPNNQHSSKQTYTNTIITTLLIVLSMICLGFVIFNLSKAKSINVFVLVLTFVLLLALPIYYWSISNTSFKQKYSLLFSITFISSVATIGTILFYVFVG